MRNQFTLGWHPDEYSRDFYEKTLMDSVRSHIYDYKSPVALSKSCQSISPMLTNSLTLMTLFYSFFSVAQLTGTIRFIQYQMEEFKVRSGKRRFYRREVLQFIEQRHEMLKNLRETDYKQYEWLLERLDLQFKPQPQKEDEIMVARKEGLRQMTKAYCDGIREQRLNAYRDELKAQQVPFLEQKLKNLEFIRNEQIELKTTVTITQQQIDDVRKQYEELKQIQDTHKVESTKKKWKIY